MQSDLLDAEARLRAHRAHVLAELRGIGIEEWELRQTIDRHGPLGLDELVAQVRGLEAAKREGILRLMRAPGSSRA